MKTCNGCNNYDHDTRTCMLVDTYKRQTHACDDFQAIKDDKLLCGGIKKFVVLNNNELSKWLTDKLQNNLQEICETISDNRKSEGKQDNEYIVINTDEPYAAEVIEVMKRNGHWG